MKTFETSRLISGNRVFPTKITIDFNKVIIKKNGIFSSDENVIPISKIVSVKINTPIFNFSSLEIVTENETIKIDGLSKSDVKEMRDLILD